jgi:hypothetical protein
MQSLNNTPIPIDAALAKKLQRLPDTNKAYSGLGGPIGMTPSELILEIRQVLNNLL